MAFTHTFTGVVLCHILIAVSTDAVSGAPLTESLSKHPVTPHLAHDDPGHHYAPRGAAPARRLRPGARRSRERACEHEPRLRFWLRRRRRLDELVERANAAVLAQDEDVETHRHDGATAPGQHLPEELDQVMVRVGVAGRLEDVRLRGHPFLVGARDARSDLVKTTGCSLR